jgi:hypothetical protein
MDRAFLATVVAAVVLLAGGLAAGAYLSDTGLFDRRTTLDPAVTQFEATGGACGPPPGNVTVTQSAARQSSFLTVRGNATVPDSSYTVTPELERTGLANYTLHIDPEATEKPTRTCEGGRVAQAAYTASIQIPNGENEPFRVVIRHGNETVRVYDNDPTNRTQTPA